MDNYKLQKINQEYLECFRGMSDEQLIDAFNREVRNGGWTITRSFYLSGLHKEFGNRNYDYSDIGDKGHLSFLKKIKLVGKKIIIDPTDK